MKLDRRELSGAVADVGVLVPIAVALIVGNGLSATAVLLPAGLLYLAAAAVYRLPVPVQPLKAFGAIAIAKGLGSDEIAAGALLMGVVFVILGRLRLLFRGPAGGKETAAIAQAPPVTQRERDVLLALCRPLLTGDAFTEPASIRAIAAELVVSEAAVKQHLSRLYVKFDVGARGERRRVQLANAAVARGAVKLGDLQAGG